MLQDLRYGFRQLRSAPMFACAAIFSLALGIGANTAVFTLINSFLLQFLPVREPANLVLFYDGISSGVNTGNAYQGVEFSSAFHRYLGERNDSFTGLCAFRQGSDRVLFHAPGESSTGLWERAKVHLVSGNYFEVLGVRAAIGRVFAPSDDLPSSPRTAVLSYEFWRDRFHLDRSIPGRVVVLNGTAFTVIGVAAPEFFGERIEPAPNFWLPLSSQPEVLHTSSYLTARDVYWLNFMGRLRPGVTIADAQMSVNMQLHQFFLEQAGSRISSDVRRQIESARIHLKAGGGGISGLRTLYSQPLHLLMAVVGVVLLIACANVATLLLARTSARHSEFVARLALGASRARLIRQVLTESVLLSFSGGIAGVALAWWGVKLLIVSLQVTHVVRLTPDPLVLGFTVALCFLTGILFGISPALAFSRVELRPRSAAAARRPRRRWGFSSGQSLIGLQVALSTILLFGAGLLARSLLAVEQQHVGFQRDNILVIRTDASLAGYQPDEYARLYRELDDRFSRLPGVISAGIARFTPVSGTSSSGNFTMEGSQPPPNVKMNVYDLPAGPHFFETLQIPVLQGRTIDVRDTASSPGVAVVNQVFVRTYLAGQNPIGRHMMLGDPFKAPGFEIVGVVADSRFYDLHESAPPMVFFPLSQKPTPVIDVILRTAGEPLAFTPTVRRVFREIDSRLPILEATTLNAQVENSLRQQRMISTLCGVFGGLALALTAVGIYGVNAYSVAARTHEIGVRMAIGAQRRQVVWLIGRDSLVLVGGGLVAGMPLAMAASRWLESFLFGVHTLDPWTMGGVAVVIVGVAVSAGFFPARRAASIDPMRALRHD